MRNALLLIAALAAPMTLSAQTACVGHFVNQSNYQWSISGYDGTDNQLIIPPGTTMEIPYGNASTVTISGNVPDRPVTMQFQLQPSGNGCFTIAYSGNPGYITLNNPNPGDVVTCAGGC